MKRLIYMNLKLIKSLYLRCKSCGWPLCGEKCQESKEHVPGKTYLIHLKVKRYWNKTRIFACKTSKNSIISENEILNCY